ncbi:putative alpha carbonic anhydrase 1, chloroplastic-like [Sesbania bispinosa]|nr:putative alpha carbonic anhydrase 1, chloroplastic-like [Sesbania bispinosa]
MTKMVKSTKGDAGGGSSSAWLATMETIATEAMTKVSQQKCSTNVSGASEKGDDESVVVEVKTIISYLYTRYVGKLTTGEVIVVVSWCPPWFREERHE